MTEAQLRQLLASCQEPVVPLVLTKVSGGGDDSLVSPSIGYPYLLDTLAIWCGFSPTSTMSWQAFISDDADVTGFPRFTGEPLYRHYADLPLLSPHLPITNVAQTTVFVPRKRVARAPTRIKIAFRTGVAGAAVAFVCYCIPLPGGAILA